MNLLQVVVQSCLCQTAQHKKRKQGLGRKALNVYKKKKEGGNGERRKTIYSLKEKCNGKGGERQLRHMRVRETRIKNVWGRLGQPSCPES